MKKSFFPLIFISMPFILNAQWSNSGSDTHNTNIGHVLIGSATSPPSDLKTYGKILSLVAKNNTALQGEFLGSQGWWGFRTDTDNKFHLDVYNDNSPKSVFSINQQGQAFFNARKSDSPLNGEIFGSSGWWGFRTGTDNGFYFDIYNSNSPKTALSINQEGNVGIGTTAPGSFKLAVNGKIWSQEVNVAMTNPGPDYVFEKDYDLLSLSELETYITQNKHLPEVPSAKEMEANGLNLKEMNLLLLKKVEELTLHLIELEKRLKEIDVLKKELNNLKSKLR